MIFLFYARFLPSKSRFNRELCNRKTPMKKGNDSRKIAYLFFVGENFHDFLFCMQRFCSVDHVLITKYASVKHNPKSVMTAGNSHVFCFCLVKIFMIFLFHATFLPSISRFNRRLCKRKTQSNKRKTFIIFLFYPTFMPNAQYITFLSQAMQTNSIF